MRWRWPWCALLLTACGARTSLDEEPRPQPQPPQLLACIADLPARTAHFGPPGEACGQAPSLDGAAVTALADFAVWLARGNEAASITELFPDEPREGLSSHHGVVTSRGVFAAVAAFASRDGAERALLELVVLDRSSQELRARLTWEMPDANFGNDLRLFGNDRGIFALGARLGDSIVTHVVDVTGRELVTAEGFLPIGDPDPVGRIPVTDETLLPERPAAWLDPCSGERAPVRASGAYGLDAVQGALVGFDAEGPGLVIETSETTRTISLPSDVTRPFEILPSGKALLSTSAPLGFVVVDLASGAAERRTLSYPAGYERYAAVAVSERFDSNVNELHVTSSGGLLLPMRDAAEGYAFVSGEGQFWNRLGRPIGEVYRAFVVEAGGTVLHFGSDFAVNLPPWAPPLPGSDRIDGMSLQLIRPESGVRADFPATNTRRYVLTEDGGCLGYAVEGQLLTLSAADATARNYVIGASTFDGVDAFAFAVREGVTLLAQ